MQKIVKLLLPYIFLVVASFGLILLYAKANNSFYLNFSDTAKSADIARNIVTGIGYRGTFSFWTTAVMDFSQVDSFPSPWIPPLMPFSIALAYKLFGVSDVVIMGVSSCYFILLVVFTFLLGRKLFGMLTGMLSAIAVATNVDFLNYATNGSTEALFTFEIVTSLYLISLKNRWAMVGAVVFATMLYFTRPQAFIYITGLLLYWTLLNFKIKKAITLFLGFIVIGFLVDYFIMPEFAGRHFLYSVTGRSLSATTQIATGGSPSDSLRGGVAVSRGILDVLKKTFYNFYNFYKLLPQIMNPYLFALFIIGLFKWGRNKIHNSFKMSSVFMMVVTFLVVAASIPFFRYLHPVVPLVYILAIAALVDTVGFKALNNKFIPIISTVLVLIFAAGQSAGMILLDSRFVKNTHNVGKPPVYVLLSTIMRENTQSSDCIITNLDTWGSWYGNRQTVWFPVEPGQMVDNITGKIPFDAIYLTSYKMDDENYYMGKGWRMIFDNPGNPKKWICDGCIEIAKEFTLKGVYKISAGDNYERQDASGILLVRKH